MNPLLATFGDPIWQILTVILVLALLVGIVAVRTRDVHDSTDKKRRETCWVLLLGVIIFVPLSGGEILFHAQQVSPPQVASRVVSSIPTAGPTAAPTPTSDPSLGPTPTPRLAHSITQVLTTFCDAIDRHDLNTAWAQYAKALQKERAAPPPFLVRITIVHCRVDDVRDTSATGLLLLKTIGPNGYGDDYERDFQFTLSVEEGAWKITQIARCFADGCLPDTTSIVP